jgi:ABC-type sugar transport system ATPase subunit
MTDAAHATQPLLRMEQIGKEFAGVRVLDDVQFHLRAGEVHVLAGENGAGKSTLMKILCGVYADYHGSIRLNGAACRFHSTHDAARAGIAVIHQEMSLIPAMSVVDNLHLGREQCGPGGWLRRAAQRRAAQALLARLGVAAPLDTPVESLPMHLRQLLEIAKALALDARVIIFDEPTSALHEPDVVKLFAIIAELKQRGCGIVYITHKMKEIYAIADRITVLRDGACIGTAPAAELPREKLINWMVGRAMTQQFPPRQARPGALALAVRNCMVANPAGGPRPVVNNVSFAVRAGEILGIAGLQGSGNSELLNAVFGAYARGVSGRLEIAGAACPIAAPSRAIARRLALVTNDRQATGIIPGLGITPNVTLAALPAFSSRGWLRQRAETAAATRHVAALNIRARGLTQSVETLSGGNQQKVVLARWLETQPRVLLLDEPTRGVDVGAKHDMYALMNQWTAAGMALVLITSEMPELLAMADRILVMHRGTVTAEFARAAATQEAILHAAMGGS